MEPGELPRGATLGRFVILERIGQGAMGVVYGAYDPANERKVTLKLLRPGDAERAQRLLREAQTIARIAHPHLLAVHEVGEYQGQIFVAMEHLEGPTLAAWLDEAPRDWPSIIDRFLQAGRGLAAAHTAGLVHGAFGPDKVLVGKDGRMRVADFGLVTIGPPSAEPAHAAPEHQAGTPGDARSDQYAFCASLQQALSPAGAKVPPWIRKALERGLRTAPGDRFPYMDALLVELTRDPDRSRRKVLAAAAAAVVLAGAGAATYLTWAGPRGRSDRCAGAEAKLEGTWDDQGREAIRTAFAATRSPLAAEAAAAVERTFDGYAQGWVEARRQACQAAPARGPGDPIDLRSACLDRRLGELQALATVFAQADPLVVGRAVEAAQALEPTATCFDAAGLQGRTPPPNDLAALQRIAALERALARVKALRESGKIQEALAEARPAAEAARAAGYRPVEAEALLALGTLQLEGGEKKAAEESLFGAYRAALAGGMPELAARAAILEVRTTGRWLGDARGAARWAELARAALEAMAHSVGAEELTGELEMAEGELALAAGRLDEALAKRADGIARLERALGASHPRVALALGELCQAQQSARKLDDGLAPCRKAVRILEEAYGPKHPSLGRALASLARALAAQGKSDEALQQLKRAVEVVEPTGPTNPELAAYALQQGEMLDAQGRHAEAEPLLRKALASHQAALGRDRLEVAGDLNQLAKNLSAQGRTADAAGYALQSIDLLERIGQKSHPYLIDAIDIQGEVAMAEKRPGVALRHYRQALAMSEASLGPGHPRVATELFGIGSAYLELRELHRAVLALERSLEIRERLEGIEPLVLANTRFALARALAGVPRKRARALELAQRAREVYLAFGDAAAGELRRVDAWRSRYQRRTN
jgi:tetratricopeptide (TPR) repeat protein